LRIAHISDLHFASLTTEDRAEYVEKFLWRAVPVGVAGAGGIAWLMRDPKRRKTVLDLVERVLFEKGKIRPAAIIAAVVLGLTGLGVGYVYRHAIMKLLVVLLYAEDSKIREFLLKDLVDKRPDHIVVSGDLTSIASDAEFQKAADFVRVLMAKLPNASITIVPGNHDLEDADAGSDKPKLHLFAKYLGASSDGGSFPSVRRFDGVTLVELRSPISLTNAGVSGALGSTQIKDLDDILGSQQHGAKVLVMHHHLKNPWKVGMQPLEDGKDLIALAKTHGVEVILHGHKHSVYKQVLNGVLVLCAGTTTLADSPVFRGHTKYWVLDFEDGRLVDRKPEPVTIKLPR